MSSRDKYYPDTPDYVFKFVVVGDANVGKSSLLARYVDGKFYKDYISTIGVDFKIKTVRLPEDKLIKLQIWDTAGQERFFNITENYYRGAMGALCVFALDDKNSFESIRRWMDGLKKYKTPKIMLVGNKSDIEPHLRRVTSKEIIALCDFYVEDDDEYNYIKQFQYIETSALNGDSVNETFMIIVKDLVEQLQNGKCLGFNDKKDGVVKLSGIDPYSPQIIEEPKKKKCC